MQCHLRLRQRRKSTNQIRAHDNWLNWRCRGVLNDRGCGAMQCQKLERRENEKGARGHDTLLLTPLPYNHTDLHYMIDKLPCYRT